MGIIWMIIIGAIVGLLARALMPGQQSMGWIGTILLGIVGSFVGGFLSTLVGSNGSVADLHPAGFLWSLIGALIVLGVVVFAGRRRGAV